MVKENVNDFNVTQLFNMSLGEKSFSATYTERCFVNETLGYRDKLIINLPDTLFNSLKSPLQKSLQMNRIQNSCLKWINNQVELLVEFPQRKTYTFGDGEWKVQRTFVKAGEICFVVERLTSAEKKSATSLPDTNMVQLPFNIQDIFSSCKEMFRMVTIIIIMVVNVVSMLLEFVYKVLLLFPTVIESLMPLFLSIVDGITKCIGGFYLLLVALRNGPQQPKPQPSSNNQFLPIDYQLGLISHKKRVKLPTRSNQVGY